MKKNDLKKLIRSHESCINGVDYPLKNCITIFSNSDYCGTLNKAAVLLINQESDDSESSPSDDVEDNCSLTVSDDSTNNLTEKELLLLLFELEACCDDDTKLCVESTFFLSGLSSSKSKKDGPKFIFGWEKIDD